MNEAGIGWIAAIIMGGLAGWLAEIFLKSGTDILMNIVLGIVGAALANFRLGIVGVSLGGWLGYLPASRTIRAAAWDDREVEHGLWS